MADPTAMEDASIDGRAVVGVVGNGPPAITLSLLLSGRWPAYLGGHPDAVLAAKLTGTGCLLESDLPPLCEALAGRGNNPVGRLFDALHHPDADSGKVRPTGIDLQNFPERALSHKVLGSALPGGSWHAMAEGMLTLSPGFWMELPGWSLFDWGRANNRWLDPAVRMARAEVARYFADYVVHMGLESHFDSGVRVTSATHDSGGWKVTALGADGQERHYQFERLVLATGMYDRPRKLGVSGEHLPFVTHRAGDCSGARGPLLVVGAGLSAADGILAARAVGRDVVHVFTDDPEQTAMARLDAGLYPEYAELSAAMGGAGAPGYVPLANTRLTAIDGDRSCLLSGPEGAGRVTVESVAVLIGSDPDLGFMHGAVTLEQGRLPVDPYTFRADAPDLYAIGPLAGDNFVRFITGHALGAARDILLTKV